MSNHELIKWKYRCATLRLNMLILESVLGSDMDRENARISYTKMHHALEDLKSDIQFIMHEMEPDVICPMDYGKVAKELRDIVKVDNNSDKVNNSCG